ncbi:hypothetical protein [Derxia lacustris]|uniref:hypothetical protein n=1 Tax=Derxia lacustris TaxID=764842 RepID=UPI00111C8C39|nr:hypothetical protein [Derxia lacustris]
MQYRCLFVRRMAAALPLRQLGLGVALSAALAAGAPALADASGAQPALAAPAVPAPRALPVAAAAAVAAPIPAGELPPLDAVVSYESLLVSHAGITETRNFRNLLIRRPGHVWMQRLLPEHRAGHGEAAEHGGHKHFDFEAATQHLTRDAAGAVRADYVDDAARLIVFLPPAEYAVAGFDGSWEGAAALVPQKVVMAMPRINRPAPAGAEWHEERRNGWTNRVLWSNTLRVALEIETGRDDGSVRRITRVVPRTPALADAELPWLKLKGYEQKEYQDFLD